MARVELGLNSKEKTKWRQIFICLFFVQKESFDNSYAVLYTDIVEEED